MALIEDDHMIEALSTDRTDVAFAIGILPGRARCSNDFLDAHVLDAISERPTVDPIAIADQEPRGLVERKGLDDLLRRPFSRGTGGDVEVRDIPPVVTQDDEGEEYAKRRGGDGEEVDRDDISNMVIQEGSPGWRRRFATTDSVLVHGRLGNVVAEQDEFRVNAWYAPEQVPPAHPSDQITDYDADRSGPRRTEAPD